MADALFLAAAVGVPLALGLVAAYLRRPWWWAAAAAVVLFLIVVIAPTPEEGESRLTGEDAIFLAIVSLIVVALAWVGAWVGRRLGRGRTTDA